MSVYATTDANALRACPTHLKQFSSGVRSRTFFVNLPFIPEATFTQGYRHAVKRNLPRTFQENDDFRWVRLDDLIACSAGGAQTWAFTGVDGHRNNLPLYNGYFRSLRERGYHAVLSQLP